MAGQEHMSLDDWAKIVFGGLTYPPLNTPTLSVRPRTMRNYIDKHRKYISPVLGAMDIHAIKRRDVQRWINPLTTEQQWSTLPVLLTLFRMAILDDDLGLESSPCLKIQKKPKKIYRRSYRREVEILAHKYTPATKDAIFFLVLHGLRLSEAAHLDLSTQLGADGHIYIEKSENDDPTKSGKARRIPYRGYYPAIWPGESTLRRVLGKTFPEAPKVTIHSLRKTFAIECKVAGLGDEQIMNLMGHANIEITKKSYSDLLQEEELATERILRARHDGTRQSA